MLALLLCGFVLVLHATTPKAGPSAHKPFVPKTSFSSAPSDRELFSTQVLPIALVPMHGPRVAGDDQALGTVLTAFAKTTASPDLASLTGYIQTHSQSRWNAALWTNLGVLYYHSGFFTAAMNAWKAGWDLSKNEKEPKIKQIADYSITQYLLMNSRVGRQEVLKPGLASLAGRPMEGNAGAMKGYLASNVYNMDHHPETSFRCGPFALISLLKSENKLKQAYNPILLDAPSSKNGFTLAQVQDLASKLGVELQVVKRNAGAALIVPSIVHWKLNHYAAIVAFQDGKYHIKDPTFDTDFVVTQAAIDAESSGYFLVEGNSIPSGYSAVDQATSQTVYGRGRPPSQNPKDCKDCDKKTGCGGCSGAMATYSIKLMLVSLTLKDTPYWSNPAVGPPVAFTLTYSQRDGANEPPVFNQSNFGSCWTFGWNAYVIDDPSNPSNGVSIYLPGGGEEDYGAPQNGVFPTQQESQALLTRTVSGSAVTYVRMLPDGSKYIFNQPNAVTAGSRFVFLTQIVDPQGRALQIAYDSQYRINTITDATGRVTTLSYNLTSDPLKITGVSDTSGRSATFGYDSNGYLISSTDMIGIQSQFTYTPGTTDIATLKTPYGVTTFSSGSNSSNNNQRWIEVTNPIGQKERVESIDIAPIPDTDSSGTPAGMSCNNNYLNNRDTFYWDRKTYITYGTSDYTKAKIYHFLHDYDGPVQSGILESEKMPFENRVWYNYEGQYSSIHAGSTSLITAEGRILDDGSSQLTKYGYNAQGNMTQQIDPLGRETDYQYASNGIDQTQVSQKTATGHDVLSTATYNSYHQPLTIKNAANQTTTYTYTSDLDVQSVTTPPTAASSVGETTTYAYDPAHPHLPQTITGAVSGATTNYTYDSYNRESTVKDSENYTVTYSYDNLDRVTQILYPDGTTELKHYLYLDQDAATDRLGRVTHFYHDGIRQLIATQDPLSRYTRYDWCYCGALQVLTDPMNRMTKWAYDIEGRMLSKTYPDNTQTTYSYENTTSRLHSVQDALGQLTTYAYNHDDTLTSTAYTNTVHATPNLSYSYDPYYNRLTQMTDGAGTTNYAYVPVGQFGANKVLSTTGPLANNTIGYTYNSLGRITTITVNGVSQSMSYDILDRVIQIGNPLGTFNYTYLRQTQRLTQVARVGGQTTNYNYYGGPDSTVDPRLSEIQNLANDGTTVLSDFTYQYNADGNITNWVQSQGTNPQQNATYSYDSSDRLTTANLATPVMGVPTATSYYYDNADNRVSEQRDNLVVKGSFNNLNQLTGLSSGGIIPVQGKVSKPSNVAVNGKASNLNTNSAPYVFTYNLPVTTGTNNVSITALDGSGNASTNNYQVVVSGITPSSYTYDADGNCTSDATRNYEWDANNRLILITEGTNTYQFTYDGLNRRVSETDNGTLTKQWVWVGNQMAEEQDSGNNVTKRLYSQGEQQSGVAYYYTLDHLGSVREMCNNSGNIVNRYSYDPYGRTSLMSGSNLATKQYAGMYVHQTSGLYLTKGGTERPYDSSTGRWLSRDPSSEGGGINLYNYVSDDPVKLTDPLGLCANGDFKPLGLATFVKPDDGNRPDESNIIKGARNIITDAGEDVLPETALLLRYSDDITAAGQETFGDGQIFDIYVVLAYQCCCTGQWKAQSPDTMQVTWTNPDGERPLSEGGDNSYMSHTQAATGGSGLRDDVRSTVKTLYDDAKKHCSDKYGSSQN